MAQMRSWGLHRDARRDRMISTLMMCSSSDVLARGSPERRALWWSWWIPEQLRWPHLRASPLAKDSGLQPGEVPGGKRQHHSGEPGGGGGGLGWIPKVKLHKKGGVFVMRVRTRPETDKKKGDVDVMDASGFTKQED